MNTTTNPLLDLLGKHEACSEAVRWVKEGGYTDLQSAWDACERADWMLWLYANMGGDRKKLVLSACACAETAMPIWEKYSTTDRRPQECIAVARKWANGEATNAELSAATAGAAEAVGAAEAAWAARAAWAAEAARAARAARRTKALREMSVLLREIIPNPEEGNKP